MIERIHRMLIVWAEEIQRSPSDYAGGGGLVAVTRVSPSRRIHDELGARVAPLTARGCETRVMRQAGSGLSDVAYDVGRAVEQLPDLLHECIDVFYLHGSLALEVRANTLGVSMATMYRRIDSAHEFISGALLKKCA